MRVVYYCGGREERDRRGGKGRGGKGRGGGRVASLLLRGGSGRPCAYSIFEDLLLCSPDYVIADG